MKSAKIVYEKAFYSNAFYFVLMKIK